MVEAAAASSTYIFVEQSFYAIAIEKSILAGALFDVEAVHLTIMVCDVKPAGMF